MICFFNLSIYLQVSLQHFIYMYYENLTVVYVHFSLPTLCVTVVIHYTITYIIITTLLCLFKLKSIIFLSDLCVIHVVTISGVFHLFVQISNFHLVSPSFCLKAFNISYNVSVLVMNSFSFIWAKRYLASLRKIFSLGIGLYVGSCFGCFFLLQYFKCFAIMSFFHLHCF